jgi:hypothetical protein
VEGGPSLGRDDLGRVSALFDKTLRRAESSTARLLKYAPVLLPVLGLLLASLSAPRIARANSGSSFLEAVGISIAVGTVLGASTLPFYEDPGVHLSNLGYGAGAGAVFGLGVWIYGFFSDEGGESALLAPPASSRLLSRAGNSETRPLVDRTGSRGFVRQSYPSATAWMPLVSLTW